MKKIILLLMMVFTLVLLAACGKEDPGYNDEPYGDPSDNTGFGDNEIVGNDWRTWKPYGFAKRESNGVTEGIYIEAFSDDGIVHLLEDSDAYNVIQSIQTRHGSISDIYYLQETACFKDVNGDGNEDLVLSDPVGGDIITEVFLYDDIVCEYVYSEAESKNASQQ